MLHRLHTSWSLWLVCAALLALATGCGTSDYRRLVARRAEFEKTSAPFRTLFAATKLSGTPVKIRVPRAFTKSYTEVSRHPDDGDQIAPDRLQPPFLQLPGFKLCYEGIGKDPQGQKVPFNCYLAAVPAKQGDAERLAGELLAQLKEKFKETPDEWTQLDAPTPEGKALVWKKIRVEADQPFRIKAGGQVAPKDMPGIFELWLCDATVAPFPPEQPYVVLVGWRAPKSIDGPAAPPPAQPKAPKDLEAITNPETKPNLAEMPGLTAGTLTIEPAADAPEQ